MPHDTNSPAPGTPNLEVVLTHQGAARAMRVSTLECLTEGGDGPPRINVDTRRVAYWRSDVMAWLKARTSPAKRAA